MVKFKYSKADYEAEAKRDDEADYGGEKPKMAIIKLGKNSPAGKAHRKEKMKYSKEQLQKAAKHMKEHMR